MKEFTVVPSHQPSTPLVITVTPVTNMPQTFRSIRPSS